MVDDAFLSPHGLCMVSEDVVNELGNLYSEIYAHCYRRSSPRTYQITNESLMLLRHLSASGPLTVKEAANHFDRSQAAMSEMLERLIKRGQLAKVIDQRDRRRHLIWLTDDGHETLSDCGRPLSDKLLSGALSRMNESEIETLVHSMRTLVNAAREFAATTKNLESHEKPEKDRK